MDGNVFVDLPVLSSSTPASATAPAILPVQPLSPAVVHVVVDVVSYHLSFLSCPVSSPNLSISGWGPSSPMSLVPFELA